MSHFSKVKCQIKRKSGLLKALRRIENGKWANAVEEHDEAENLYGYRGDKRANKANIIIRRKHVGSSSNDLGFVLSEDGTYQAIISDYDSSHYNQKWLDKLTQLYAEETIKEVASENGWNFESSEENGEIFVMCDGGS